MTDAPGEWRRNWPLLLCCILGVPVPMAAIYAFGQFLGPLEQEFGWTRTQASAGLSVSLLLGFLASPLVGRLVDRVNARWLVLSGVVLVGLALAGFALTTSSPQVWLALWCFHSLAGALVGPTVWVAVISAAFDKHRSMAIALVLCGSGIASGFGPTSARLLIDEFGWRSAYVAFSLVWTVPILLLAALFFFDRRPRTRPATAAAGGAETPPPAPLRRTFLSGNFIKLALAVVSVQTALAAFMIHLAPALADKGLSLTQAATIAGFAGLAGIPGKLGIGYLFDRAGQARVSLGIMAMIALACVLLALDSRSIVAAVIATCVLGASSGAMFAFMTCLCRRLFDESIFGTMYGAITSLGALAGAAGPLAASAIHDAQGSYALAFWLGVGVAAVVAALLVSIPSPQASPD